MTRYRIAAPLLIFCSVLTFFLICWGGIVKSSESSLGCPDWPTCYGQLIPDTSRLSPEAARHLFWEYGHRVIGTLLGLLTIIAAALVWKPNPAFSSLRRRGLALLGLICVQGLLGGLTVHLDINHPVSTIHLGTSMLVLLFVIYMAREAWIRRQSAPPPAPWPARPAREASKWAHAAVAVIYLQILLGAIVRHSGASWAAGMGPRASILGVDPLSGETVLFSSNIYMMLNLAHRYCAVLVALLVAWAAIATWKRVGAAGDGLHRFLIWTPLLMVLFQIFVGIGMVAMKFPVFMRTMHLGMAEALLAAQFLVMIELARSARQSNAAPLAPLRASSGKEILS